MKFYLPERSLKHWYRSEMTSVICGAALYEHRSSASWMCLNSSQVYAHEYWTLHQFTICTVIIEIIIVCKHNKLTECMSNPLISSLEIYWPVTYMVYDCIHYFFINRKFELVEERGGGALLELHMWDRWCVCCVCGRKQAITTTNRYETLFYRWFLYQPTEIMMWQVKIWVIDQLIMIIRPSFVNCGSFFLSDPVSEAQGKIARLVQSQQ